LPKKIAPSGAIFLPDVQAFLASASAGRPVDRRVFDANQHPHSFLRQHASMCAATSTVFSARALTKTYGEGDTAVHALRGVDLDIVQGEFVVLLGASGSGKSTLLNILGGLDSASSGSASWTHQGQTHELTGASDAELTRYRREHVGFVFQF